MPDPRLFRLRCCFCKKGRLAWLSHLELCRALERTVRRAGLPFAVSQGFSPHMKIAFGAALPVGVGGTEEVFDLQMTRYIAPDKALLALQEASVPDLMVTSAVYIEPSAPAASVAWPISTYVARLSEACEPVVPETITLMRKKGEKTIDVGDYLKSFAVDGDEVVFELEAKSTGALRPDRLLEASLPAGVRVLSLMRIAQR